ncbi:ornithine cyclodeaminase family protein [Pelagibius sp.]|uniref:ornithine cyclodeaminase family protein n=1 Tax=Pelagibius sp. TaxID=1931238 RepID=UPI003BAF3033
MLPWVSLQKSAAEITKGDLQVMTLSETDVIKLLDMQALLDGLAEGFRALARGEVQTPDRPEITIPEKGFLLSMPAWRKGSPVMVKMVSVFEGNLERGLPNHLAMINLFDPQNGAPLCLMDGTYITGIRTAAAAVLSVREIARPDARVATVIGGGVQGREHLRLLPLVRDFDEILIASLHFEDAQRLAERHPKAKAVRDVEAAVRRSDVVCLATHAYQPVIHSDWVRPGTHVTSVGYAPPQGELPVALARDHKLYVESDASFQAPPVGCGELQQLDPATAIRLGDALVGRAPLRTSDEEITVYKAMGIAMEDLVAAELVLRRARCKAAVSTAVF